MSEITVQVDGIKHTYQTQEFLVCERCESGWLKHSDDELEPCPNCGEETEVQLAAEELLIRPKWLWDGATSIEEMVSRTEHRATLLRKLEDDGWSLNTPPKDGYAHLSRPIEHNEHVDQMGDH